VKGEEDLPENPLIEADALSALLEADPPPALLDVRWRLGGPDGRQEFEKGHLPGAVYLDLERDLAAPPSRVRGRHPLPDPADLQVALRRLGVHRDRLVVVYDDVGGLSAARAWWVLKWARLADVRLLDGGLSAWIAAGHATTTESLASEPGDVLVQPGGLATLDASDAALLARSGILLDAGAAERYRGEVEPVDAVGGHIPGAISAPTSENLAPDGRFLGPTQLRSRFEALGAHEGVRVGVYCGSGVTAAHEIVALAVAGIDAELFPGSWSSWVGDPTRPVATGAPPG